MMMRLVLVCMAFFCLTASAQTIVVDAETDEPILYASVFDKTTGEFIGKTDGAGILPAKAAETTAITLQHLNYQPSDIEMATVTDGKIRLTPQTYTVKEVAVDKGQHDYIRLKVYIRQLAWMTDTLAKVSRSICHLYFKASKGQGSPQVTVLSREALYNKDVLSGKNSKMVRGVLNFNPSFATDVSGPGHLKKLPEEKVKRLNICNLGKNWGITYARFDWNKNRCSIVMDSVRFLKPLTIPFFGISMGNIFNTETYDIHYGAPKLSNLVNMLSGMRITHKKSNTSVDLYNEVFVLDVDYASKEDLELEKLVPASDDFEEPTGFMPLNEGVRQAMLNMRTMTLAERKELLEEQEKMKKQEKEAKKKKKDKRVTEEAETEETETEEK